jgi:hypothetical protein
MSISQFSNLNTQEQEREIRYGRCIGSRYVGKNYVLLHALHGFYVETYHSVLSFKCVKISPIATTDMLTPYLDKIKL